MPTKKNKVRNPIMYAFLNLFWEKKRSATKRKRRAKKSPKMAVIVANLNIKKTTREKKLALILY